MDERAEAREGTRRLHDESGPEDVHVAELTEDMTGPWEVRTRRRTHLPVLPGITTDDSLPVDLRGVAAWSTNGGNNRLRHLPAVGDLVGERDGGDPPGTELPARMASIDSDPDRPGGRRYRLLPLMSAGRDAAYGATPGTDQGGKP